MRKWVVNLPGNRNYNLESDIPTEDLNALGYTVFGLMELDKAAMKRWWKYPPVPGTAEKRVQPLEEMKNITASAANTDGDRVEKITTSISTPSIAETTGFVNG